MKRLFLLLFLFVIICFQLMGQSVIEVMGPAEADVILLSVDKKEDADIVVYKTRKTSESKQWDCMWMFKKWGFADLSLYLYENIKDTSQFADEDLKYKIQGRVYFTENIQERGYRNPNFTIEGLIRKSAGNDTTKLLANVNNDSIPKINNDSVKVAVIPPIDSLIVQVPIDTTVARVNVSENVVFKVQVGACHRQIPEAELHKRYPGNKEVSVEMYEGWYKYLIGNYSKYSEAKQEKISSGTADAWVVVYKDNKRVPISEVVNLLTYYPLSKVLIKMLS